MKVATWNVLADNFALPNRYPGVAPEDLGSLRLARVLERVVSPDYDVLALQEVTPTLLGQIVGVLGSGRVLWSQRGSGRFDGLALVLSSEVDVLSYQQVPCHSYRRTIHPGQIVTVSVGDALLTVANLHLDWVDPSEDQKRPLAQLRSVLAALGHFHQPHIVVGDTNADPDSTVRGLISLSDFTEYQGDQPTGHVMNHPLYVDVLAARGCVLVPDPRPPLSFPLPNSEVPSDHVLISAQVVLPSPSE
jgi:hypothetical protein